MFFNRSRVLLRPIPISVASVDSTVPSLISALVILFLFAAPQVRSQSASGLAKSAGDDNSKFTNTGNIAITISNYGVFGHGFRLWPQQPSMQYPRGSGIEHCFVGGLWVGAVTPNGIRVTTGAVDVSSLRSVAEGFEFTTGVDSRVVERSSLSDNRFYSPDAVSHQDFIADFTDVNTTNPNQGNEPIPNHNPLGINVHMETYAFNFSFADNFVIFNYWIKNVGASDLDSVYVSLWADLVVRNTNVSPPTLGTPFYNQGGLGFIDTLNLAYAYDYSGDAGLADSYAAMKFLGSSPYKSTSSYQAWQFRSSIPTYFSPTDDNSKYAKMATGLSPAEILGIPKPSNFMSMVTTGPFSRIAVGDSMNVVFAVIAAKKRTSLPTNEDTPAQKVNLLQSDGWAQVTYNGEDRNGNGIQDSTETWTGPNGTARRYFLPSPPHAPRVSVVPGDKLIDVYWDASSESSIDPISNAKDFEGYRVYSTNAGVDLTESQDLLSNLNLLGEFDNPNDEIGYNTGFQSIRLNPTVQLPGDTTHYAYRFRIQGVLNGWQYGVAVSAFDSGDAATNLESLESSRLQTLKRIVPGSAPEFGAVSTVTVYPNPYYAHAYWDGRGERDRKLYFRNLPSRAEITIYTLSGDVVDQFDHDAATYTARDINWFQKYSDGTQQLSGGEHAWDLITRSDQAIATGLYLFAVKNKDTGEIGTGKFLIIK
ncbi:MAG: hypothetical protein A2X67_04665 [Ignavibacteria bacterium GWA2_55_11]|nr:MAG: hypothetical protein A2X67_04665 [Ignavibacteria bacterium GWA2_55_11]OGU70681.1 MAG: hypothetical protein A3G43_12670 [Ignavibacteria bacterium RIFCSPLOWO2_12_FULL_56_21]OGU71406.1 MAG: hypothetical protein A3H45_02555 [Ignavibacteria bacterium RIFCSPLOWO2_02_FULL_55_14]HAV22017.1 hypothetical protein [Bacteroidota bacterium]